MEQAPRRHQPLTKTRRIQHVIVVDTNVFMYAVGRPHHLREPARKFFVNSNRNRPPLCTSAEVLQKLAHAYIPCSPTRFG